MLFAIIDARRKQPLFRSVENIKGNKVVSLPNHEMFQSE